MEQLLTEIQIALANKLYFIALQATLTIPDICGAIESDDGIARGGKYCNWYNKYAKPRISPHVAAEDVYLFRCSLLHQGTTIPNPRPGQNASYSRILFAAPYSHFVEVHDCVVMDALFVDVVIFCNGMVEAAKEWIAEMQGENNANFIKNSSNTIRYYPNGIAPYITGIDTIG